VERTYVNVQVKEVVGNINQTKLGNPGHQTGFLPCFFLKKGVKDSNSRRDCQRGVALFRDLNIKVISGIQGQIYEAFQKFIKGELSGNLVICNKSEHNCD